MDNQKNIRKPECLEIATPAVLKNQLWLIALQKAIHPTHRWSWFGNQFIVFSLALACCSPQKNPAQPLYVSNYEFSEANCTTQFHEIQAEQEKELQQKLCTLLQDEQQNQSCAPTQRKQLFAKQCPHWIWKEQEKRPENPEQIENKPISLANLGTFLIERIEHLTPPTQTETSAKGKKKPAIDPLQDWLEEAKECGIAIDDTYVSSICLIRLLISEPCGTPHLPARKKISEKQLVWDETQGEEHWFFRVLSSMPNGSFIRIRQREKDLKPFVAEIFLLPENKELSINLNDWIKKNPKPMARIFFAADPKKAAWQKLESPQNLREFYHALTILWPLTKNQDANQTQIPSLPDDQKELLRKILLASKPLWKKSPEPAEVYHEALLHLILETKLLSDSEFLELCHASIDAHLKQPSQIAATYVFAENPKLTSLKTIVLETLKFHSLKEVRMKAIQGLQKIKLTRKEKRELLHSSFSLKESGQDLWEKVLKILN